VLDDHRVRIPDATGNRRLDSFGNLLENPHAGLLFLIPGMGETLRVNGTCDVVPLADVFSTPAYDSRLIGSNQKPEFAVTRLHSGPREMEKAPVYPADQAILICVSLTPAMIGQWESHLQRKKCWRHTRDTFRHDFYRPELPNGKCGLADHSIICTIISLTSFLRESHSRTMWRSHSDFRKFFCRGYGCRGNNKSILSSVNTRRTS